MTDDEQLPYTFHVGVYDEQQSELDPKVVLEYAARAAWVVVDTEVVVFDAMTATSFVLDQTAAVLWRCIDGVTQLDEILADIADAYAVPVDQVRGDFLPVVAHWLAMRIVNEVHGDR